MAVGFAFHESFLFSKLGTRLGELEMSVIFIPVLQVIMFAMGTTLSVSDFSRAFKMPLGILIGLCCQFTIMPLLGLLWLMLFSPVGIAAGLVLVGSSPSGLASNDGLRCQS